MNVEETVLDSFGYSKLLITMFSSSQRVKKVAKVITSSLTGSTRNGLVVKLDAELAKLIANVKLTSI